MQKPNGYDTSEPKEFTGFNRPEAGAYVLGIVSAEERKTKKGDNMIVLCLDIAEGEFKGHYRELSSKFGKDRLLKHYRVIDRPESTPYFKGDIKAIEESNRGYKFNFDESTLRGKFVGGMLCEEEYLAPDGDTKTSLKVGFLCSVDKAKSGTLKTPAIKKLKTGSDYQTTSTPSSGNDSNSDDLPF